MRISIRKPAALAAATTLATAGILVSTSTAAHAAGEVDIVSIRGAALAQSSAVSTTASMSVNLAPGIGAWFPRSADVYRGSVRVGTASLYKADATHLGVRFPNSAGRGLLTLRNIKIDWYAADNSSSGTLSDASTSGGIMVKGAINGNLSRYGTALKLRVRGKTHKFQFGIKYFSPTGWRNFAHHPVTLQQYSGGRWRAVKTVKLNNLGRAAWTRKTKKKFSYRLLSKPTSTVVGAYTRGTSRL